MQPSQSRRGIVNGHWEPTESRSKLLELVRVGVAKLTKKASDAAAPVQYEAEHRDHPIAAE
jgi:hypothetical protein